MPISDADRNYVYKAAKDWYDIGACDWSEDERGDFAADVEREAIEQGNIDINLPSFFRAWVVRRGSA